MVICDFSLLLFAFRIVHIPLLPHFKFPQFTRFIRPRQLVGSSNRASTSTSVSTTNSFAFESSISAFVLPTPFHPASNPPVLLEVSVSSQQICLRMSIAP